jgi:nicotinamide riboside kinase
MIASVISNDWKFRLPEFPMIGTSKSGKTRGQTTLAISTFASFGSRATWNFRRSFTLYHKEGREMIFADLSNSFGGYAPLHYEF